MKIVVLLKFNMSELKFINYFNTFLIGNIRIDYIRHKVIPASALRNTAILFANFLMVFYFSWQLFKKSKATDTPMVPSQITFEYISRILSFVVQYVALVLVLLDSLVSRRKLLCLANLMLNYTIRNKDRDKVKPKRHLEILLEMCIVIICLTVMNVYNIIANLQLISMVIIIMITLIVYTIWLYLLGNLFYPLFFAEFLSLEFAILRERLKTKPLEAVLANADLLISMKKNISQVFGRRLFFLLIQLFMNISIDAYTVVVVFLERGQDGFNIQEFVLRMNTLTINLVSLFGMTNSFERVQTEVNA